MPSAPKIVRTGASWIIAALIAAIAFFAVLVGMAFFISSASFFRTPVDEQPATARLLMIMIGYGTLLLPPMVAAFIGAIVAPRSQRQIASILFPIFAFCGTTALSLAAPSPRHMNIQLGMEIACGCGCVGLVLYWQNHRRTRRDQSEAP